MQCHTPRLYKDTTKDITLAHVTPLKSTITSYGGTTLPVGYVLVHVRWGDLRCQLDCKLVENSHIRPLLDRKACLGMKIELHKPNVGDSTVYILSWASLYQRSCLSRSIPRSSTRKLVSRKVSTTFGSIQRLTQ